MWPMDKSNHWNVWFLFCLWMCRSRRSGAFEGARFVATSRTNVQNRLAMSLCFYPEGAAKFASKKAMEVLAQIISFFEIVFYFFFSYFFYLLFFFFFSPFPPFFPFHSLDSCRYLPILTITFHWMIWWY